MDGQAFCVAMRFGLFFSDTGNEATAFIFNIFNIKVILIICLISAFPVARVLQEKG